MNHPRIIQGGMGLGVSSWQLASTVSKLGGLGVVSGAGAEILFIRRLQDGDAGGHLRRALRQFPVPHIARKILEKHFVEKGRLPDQPYRPLPMYNLVPDPDVAELAVAAAFAEVTLAKENHACPIGINLLEKMQLPTLPTLFGALLAGVDYVLMGAGIPLGIAGALDHLSRYEETELRIQVEGAGPSDRFVVRFDPRDVIRDTPPIRRPYFFPIVASATLAEMLLRKSTGRVDGFVVEGPTAGGHNAPPRGPLVLDDLGEPRYGPRDVVDPAHMKALGVPFWLAGSFARPDRLKDALRVGAAGIQVGTAFAFCRESGLPAQVKSAILEEVRHTGARVRTDPKASPTGFPFKVVQMAGTLSNPDVYAQRRRVCDLGYLRTAYRKPDGTVGFRCPAEPIDTFVKKGGALEEALGRKCLCNALLANVGLGQYREDGGPERPLFTAGDDLADVTRFLPEGEDSYSAADVLRYVERGPVPSGAATPRRQ